MFRNIENRGYKFLFLVMLLLPLLGVSFEFTFGSQLILAIILLNQRNQKISKDFITAILPLLIILFLGIIITLFHSYTILDIGKDIAYFTKPAVLLFTGYALIHSIKSQKYFFQIFVYLGIAFAIIHIYNFITYPNLFETSLNTIRNETGLSNPVELLAIVFLLLGMKYPKIQVFEKKSVIYYTLIFLLVSFILYFSRTMWGAFFLLLLAAFGYARISLKALKYLSILILIIGSFYIYLFSIEIERNQGGISTFLYKMKIAPEEIFLPKIDLNDHASLWDHWRAYEAKMAFDQLEGQQYIFGKGLGSLVDLKFVAPLNEEGMRYISHLHNGYAMIYYKTGILGLLFYLLFVLNIYLFTFYTKHVNTKIPINNLIAAIGVYLFFSTLIITGAYNLKDIYLLALGGLFAQYDKFKNVKVMN